MHIIIGRTYWTPWGANWKHLITLSKEKGELEQSASKMNTIEKERER